MNRERVDELLGTLMEELATIEHERWADWQRFVHSQGQVQQNGDLVIPSELVAKWTRQIQTSYSALSEAEKESDREQVRRYLPLLVDALSKE